MKKYSEPSNLTPRMWLLVPVLLLPLVATAISMSVDLAEPLDDSCESVRTFLEQTDAVRISKDATVLVIGGESFTRWKFRSAQGKMTPDKLRVKASPLMSPHTVARCFERAIAHYQPFTTVLFLDPEDGLEGAEATLNALDEIVDKRTYWSVSPGLVVVPPTITPALKGKTERLTAFELNLEAWAADKVGVEILDTGPLFSDASGAVDPRLFWPDGRTLGVEGCDRLRGRLVALAGTGRS